jgi:hypothetical protein
VTNRLTFTAGQKTYFPRAMTLVPESPNVPHPILLLPVILGQWAKEAGTFPAATKVAQAREALRRAQNSVASAKERLAAISTPGEAQTSARRDVASSERALANAQAQFAQAEKDSAKVLAVDVAQRAAEAREYARQLLCAVEIVAGGMVAAGEAAEAAGVDAKAFADGELLAASARHLITNLGLE